MKIQKKDEIWAILETRQEQGVTKQAKTTPNSHHCQTICSIRVKQTAWMIRFVITPHPINSISSIMADSA
jgi:hypothetical protein